MERRHISTITQRPLDRSLISQPLLKVHTNNGDRLQQSGQDQAAPLRFRDRIAEFPRRVDPQANRVQGVA